MSHMDAVREQEVDINGVEPASRYCLCAGPHTKEVHVIIHRIGWVLLREGKPIEEDICRGSFACNVKSECLTSGSSPRRPVAKTKLPAAG